MSDNIKDLDTERAAVIEKKIEEFDGIKKLKEVLSYFKKHVDANTEMYRATDSIKEILHFITKNEIAEEEFEFDDLVSEFLTGNSSETWDDCTGGAGPAHIALIALREFVEDKERFEIVDPTKLPSFEKIIDKNLLKRSWPPAKPKNTAIVIAKETFSVPMSAHYFVRDKSKDNHTFIIKWELGMAGFSISVLGEEVDIEDKNCCAHLFTELKTMILKSRLVKGQVLEVGTGGNFKIKDLSGEHVMPTISKELADEFDKNIVNLFKNRAKFKEKNMALKRSIILEGLPGNGKTLICRSIANSIQGDVTTLWVTGKSIAGADDVSSIFDMARELSPTLIIMEDLDMISGTRMDQTINLFQGKPLGEMLNQLDGLTKNDAVVVIGTTNEVSLLDAAINDRPGRFDRIFTVGKPTAELAAEIAKNRLIQLKVDETTINTLDLENVSNGQFTGAQIVEIIDGAMFEAIHRECVINEICLMNSKRGLEDQRKLLEDRRKK